MATSDYQTSSTTSTDVWESWNDTTTSTTTYSSGSIWYTWCSDSTAMAEAVTISSYPIHEPSEEELAERAREAEERDKARQEQQRQQEIALEKSKQLLLDSLDEPNQERLHRDRQIHVWSKSGKSFRIKCGRQHNIFEMDAEGKDIREYCIHVKDVVPNFDNMLAQKLMLESYEEEFLRVANVRQLA